MRRITKYSRLPASLAVLGMAACFAPSTALGFCYAPSAPLCTSMYGVFQDDLEFSKCRLAVEMYRNDSRSYILCLNEQQASLAAKVEEASDDVNEAVSAFNRRARKLP